MSLSIVVNPLQWPSLLPPLGWKGEIQYLGAWFPCDEVVALLDDTTLVIRSHPITGDRRSYCPLSNGFRIVPMDAGKLSETKYRVHYDERECRAIRLREFMTGKGADTFEQASQKTQWLKLADEVTFNS